MNLSSSTDYKLLQNKFLNLMVVLWFWDFVALATKKNLVAMVYTGEFGNIGEPILTSRNPDRRGIVVAFVRPSARPSVGPHDQVCPRDNSGSIF